MLASFQWFRLWIRRPPPHHSGLTLWSVHWQTLVRSSTFWDTEQKGKFTEKQLFTLGTDLGTFRAQGSTCCIASESEQSKNGGSSRRHPLQGFRNFPQCTSVCMKVPVFLNQEAGGSGGWLLVRVHQHQHHRLTAPQRTPIRWSTMAHFLMFLALLPRNFQHLFLRMQISGVLN